MLHRGEQFPHNYNAVSRSAFYTWLNRHFRLGIAEPVVERDYEPLTREQLTVWDAEHQSPKANDPDLERRLLKWLADDAGRQLRQSTESIDQFRNDVGKAIEVLVGRTYEAAGEIEWKLAEKHERDSFIEMVGLLRNTYGEELPVVWLYPKNSKDRVVIWLDDGGKSSLYDADGEIQPYVVKLVAGGATVLGADLLFQGEFLADGKPVSQQRVVSNPREAPAYTFGYNDTLFAQRTHDVLTLVKFVKTAKIEAHPNPKSLAVAGFGAVGPIVAAARALAGSAIDRAAVDTQGFRFGQLLDYRNPLFLPGGAKYFDLPGLLALNAPHALWLAGETSEQLFVLQIYRLAGGEKQLTIFGGNAIDEPREAAAKWLLE